MQRKSLALLTLSFAIGLGSMGVGMGDAFAHDDDEDSSPAPAASDMQPGARASKSARSGSKSRASKSRRRRSRVSGHVVPELKLRAEAPPPPSGKLKLHSLAFNETIEVQIYNDDGSYNVEALKEITRVLRCKRTDAEKDVEPRLTTILSHVYDRFGGRPVEVVSGFRNQRKTTSYHYKASASDIRITGVKPVALRSFVESLDAGGMGVGIYPKTGFVHVDVRPPPSYRWVDYSRSNSNASEKRPPRGWKRTRPVS